MTFARILPVAAVVALLVGCSTAAPEPEAPTGCIVTTDSATQVILLDLPDGFAESDDDACVWNDGDRYLALSSTSDPDLVDIDDQREESEAWIGIGGDEDVSDFSFDEAVDLFPAQQGDILAYRSAADGVPIVVIVGQSADYQLSFSASADETDVATALVQFREIAASLTTD